MVLHVLKFLFAVLSIVNHANRVLQQNVILVMMDIMKKMEYAKVNAQQVNT